MGQNREFRGTARRIEMRGDIRCYLYHSTVVVSVYPNGGIVLNSGGWRSATTKLAMNQASNEAGLGFHVFQHDHDWFVRYQGGDRPFADNMILRPALAQEAA